jgi:hypothetical protein
LAAVLAGPPDLGGLDRPTFFRVDAEKKTDRTDFIPCFLVHSRNPGPLGGVQYIGFAIFQAGLSEYLLARLCPLDGIERKFSLKEISSLLFKASDQERMKKIRDGDLRLFKIHSCLRLSRKLGSLLHHLAEPVSLRPAVEI